MNISRVDLCAVLVGTAFALSIGAGCGDSETGGSGGAATSATSVGGTGGGGTGGTGTGGGMGGSGGAADCSSMTELCTTHCNAYEAESDVLMCAGGGIIAADCIATCEQSLTTATSCTCEYLAWNQCHVDAGASGLVCDMDGDTILNPAICVAEAMAFGACMN